MEDENGGLFNIEVSSADESANEEKVPRDFQSEEDYQRQRAAWKPKVETGELWKTLKLPMDHPTKQESQVILHAIEELYFYRRYKEAGNVAEEVLKGELIEEYRKAIVGYLERCKAKSKRAKAES